MRINQQLRRWITRMGLAASILLFCLWILSSITRISFFADSAPYIKTAPGAFTGDQSRSGLDFGSFYLNRSPVTATVSWDPASLPTPPPKGFEIHMADFSSANISTWLSRFGFFLPDFSVAKNYYFMRIPFPLLMIAVAVPTVLFWRRTRPKNAGHCSKCEYDLTGNTTGVCPECGLKTSPISTPIANPSVTAPP